MNALVRPLRLSMLVLFVSLAGLSGESAAQSIGDSAYCFQSGSGATFFRWCLDEAGLLTGYETPAGQHHALDRIDGEEDANDYFVLYDSVDSYQLGPLSIGPFTRPVIVSGCEGAGSRLPCVLRTTTLDGRYEVTRIYNQNAAEKEVNIDYVIKNTSAALATSVRLLHGLNFDLDNTIGGDVASSSARSAWGVQVNRFGLTAASYAFPTLGAGTFLWGPGDPAGYVIYSVGSIKPGYTRKVRIQYRRD